MLHYVQHACPPHAAHRELRACSQQTARPTDTVAARGLAVSVADCIHLLVGGSA